MTIHSENLTISVPNEPGEVCNKNCPYCISKMTGYVKNDFPRMIRKVNKVKRQAMNASVNSVLFTGKGEPLYGESFEYLMILASYFKDEFPLELQTNGILLNEENIDILDKEGFDVIAISMDSPKMMEDMKESIRLIKDKNMVVRLTFNITRLLEEFTFDDLFSYCKENKVNQMTLREIISPEFSVKNEKVKEWIDHNAGPKVFEPFQDDALKAIRKFGVFRRRTNFGVDIFDLDGVSFSTSEYCIQESAKSDYIRSLVFLEDSHLYTSWGSPASILF